MKKSLHFGMNVLDSSKYGGWPGYLSGCWSDATRTAQVMATAGFEARGAYDADCTLKRLRDVFTEAASTLNAGDTFLFSDSGHGSQNPGPLSGNEEGLCLYDGIMVDSEFRYLLSLFRVGVNIVVVLDVCHAAGLSREMPHVRARVAPLFITRSMKGSHFFDVKVAANTIILAACATDELSGDGDDNGAFTGSWLSVLNHDMTWRQWMTATSRFMSERFPTQHPELLEIGGTGLADSLIA